MQCKFRFAELEDAANANQAALLASLEAEELSAAAAKTKRAHRGKKKKKGSKSPLPEPLAAAVVRGVESPKPFQDSPPPTFSRGLSMFPSAREPGSRPAVTIQDAAVVRPLEEVSGCSMGEGEGDEAAAAGSSCTAGGGEAGAVGFDKARLWVTVREDSSVGCRILGSHGEFPAS
jgi:hypothetical protein